MASKRVELAKQQQKLQGTVQINTNVDDAQKSIEELINAGVRTHEQNRNHFLQRKTKLPSSFYQPRIINNSCKSRGSSVGHSREGSSDDGLGCSSGRHTLSPSSMTNFSSIQAFNSSNQSNFNGDGIVHQRQASAPALINCNIMDQNQFHQQHQSFPSRYECSTSRSRPISSGVAGLPPVAHTYSRSLNTVTIHSQMTPNDDLNLINTNGNTNNQIENIYGNENSNVQTQLNNHLPSIVHQRSVKSCDFDVINASIDDTNVNFNTFNHPVPQHHVSQQQINNLHNPHELININNITTSGDLATYNDFYIENKLNSTNGNYWTNPRAKSQSLDPITLTATASPIGGILQQQQQPSSSLALTAPGSTASLTSSSSSQQQFILQQHQQQQNLGLESCSGNNMDGLPEGWAIAIDNNGDTYFIDHYNKTTTWYDPRLSKEAQEERIKMHYSFVQQNNVNIAGNNNCELKQSQNKLSATSSSSTPMCQHLLSPQHQQQQTSVVFHQHNINSGNVAPNTAVDRIQQLKLERNYMLERRQQLCRAGLLDRAGRSQQQNSSVKNDLQQQTRQNFYGQPTQPDQQQHTTYSTNSANINDSVMEVDFHQAPSTLHSGLHQIDPVFVQDLSASDLNPHEFDKYLQITDTNRQYRVMQ